MRGFGRVPSTSGVARETGSGNLGRTPKVLSRIRAGMWSRRRGNELSGSHPAEGRSEEHTSELQSLMRISYAVFCLKKKKKKDNKQDRQHGTRLIKTSTKRRIHQHK